MSVRETIDQGVENLYPGYFALVMATGIVSMAIHLLQISSGIAWLLFQINKVAYGILWILTLARLVRFHQRVLSDLADDGRGPGFFTVVAGTGVLGSQFVFLSGDFVTGTLFWFLGLFLWFLLTYGFLTAVIAREAKPKSPEAIHGGWLVAVVATQSISVLGIMIAAHWERWQEVLLFFALLMFLLGCMQYILIITLILYRLIFFPLAPKELSPPYWVNMGATAITTLAGAELMLNSSRWAFLGGISPFLKGFTLFFWTVGTWWIPLLIFLGIWRHVCKKFPVRYDPMYWSLVFPLGMYTVCTFQLGKATGLSFFSPISNYFVYFALLSWAIVSGGLIRRILKNLFITREQS